MKPKRIQRKRTKGWRMPPNTVYVGRPSKWGNPWTVKAAISSGFYKPEYAPLVCITEYAAWLKSQPSPNSEELGIRKTLVDRKKIILDSLKGLRGKNLACWCKEGEPCHADVLLELANQ
jgi:hypothetical protein